ncbi:CRISPR-associated protein [Fusobacterium sp.]|uniref:CRISPR-associated protein n=1 Tax=Fusobacterium nucleatum TaxID=851 RepID=A0A323U1C7_FUSNU|nr:MULTISPECIES: CRISPR-associated protein [Fusobacterium]PCR85537.1 CRISPR-associated protein [Fusobacterium nucleatum]PZA05230.1 CRISPR-associated protein [Fusobacterium nucleatum]QJX50999.1 CRISPR-associated protein [Fusobacterium nucleatum]HCE32712.1 CRISPR-associated protein [Fusobacterium sp.]
MSKKILLTFAGNTDPTRGEHDGPIIHICRYYKPDKIYLILTKEMEERNEEPYNIYKRAIKENLKNYNPEIICIKTGIKDAHHFDIYFNWIYETFEIIKKDEKDTEIYLNMTSGTSQMTTNLLMYYIDSLDLNLIPIQVETYKKQSNQSEENNKTVDKHYDVEAEAICNLDNEEKTRTYRIVEPDLKKYSRILTKNQIEKLLEQYKYEAISELLKRNIFDKNLELNTLVNFAIERTNLKGLDCNKKLNSLNNKDYNKLYYFTKDKNITRIPDWYQIVDFFSLANIKQKTEDISSYTLMLEPIVVKIYLSILKDLMGKNLDELFRKDSHGYKVELKRLEEDLKEMIKKDLKREYLKDDTNISTSVLGSIIKYYLKKENNIEVNYFTSLAETLAKMKTVRNTLAHELRSISREDFNKESETTVEQINSKILEFFNKFYTSLGYKKEMVEIYDNINKEIVKLLK